MASSACSPDDAPDGKTAGGVDRLGSYNRDGTADGPTPGTMKHLARMG